MGGFMEADESLYKAAEKVLYRYTKQKNIYMEQVKAYGEIDRDTGGTGYFCSLLCTGANGKFQYLTGTKV